MDRRRFLAAIAALPLTAGVPLPLGAETKPPPPLRILAFGDSLTAGYGLAQDAGFIPALSRWVRQRQARAVVFRNAGLSGDTTYGGRIRIGWELRWRPDAVIVELGANDMLMGMAAAQSARNLDVILQAAGAGGRPVLLLGIGAVGEAGFRSEWDAIWPDLAARHGALLLADLYATIRTASEAERRTLLQADGVHPSAAGVARMVALAGPAALKLIERAGARDRAPPARG